MILVFLFLHGLLPLIDLALFSLYHICLMLATISTGPPVLQTYLSTSPLQRKPRDEFASQSYAYAPDH